MHAEANNTYEQGHSNNAFPMSRVTQDDPNTITQLEQQPNRSNTTLALRDQARLHTVYRCTGAIHKTKD